MLRVLAPLPFLLLASALVAFSCGCGDVPAAQSTVGYVGLVVKLPGPCSFDPHEPGVLVCPALAVPCSLEPCQEI